MKKLMLTAATVAIASGAFAAPLVYDYKASVKHIDLKEVSVRNGLFPKAYQKVQKSSSLKGYLIVDADGATSPTITGSTATALDQGRNRAFLVVQNNSVKADIRRPKILPAVLDAKWIDQKFNVAGNYSNTGLAEGYLFVGGDAVATVRPKLDLLAGTVTERGAMPAPAASTAGMTSIQDYLWTSIYLFGKYNAPEWFVGVPNTSEWDQAETAIDGNMVAGVQTAFGAATPRWSFYHDTWMNGAGIGKWVRDVGGEICCGMGDTFARMVLNTLSGNLKGGLFLCTENGTYVTGNYVYVGGQVWEEQFFCPRITDGSGTWCGTDLFQTDLWQDGNNELNTTDVVFGSWSIKRRAAYPVVAATLAEMVNLNAAIANNIENSAGLADLVSAIKGAALRLNANTIFSSATEIYNLPAATAETNVRNGRIPLITPQFAAYYGLDNFN